MKPTVSRPLTSLEASALRALFDESAANGHDFGCIESVVWPEDRKALGALVTNLSKLDLVTVYPREAVNGGPRFGGHFVTQFVLSREGIEAMERGDFRTEAPAHE